MFFKNLKHTLLAASACLVLHTAQGQTQPWQTNGTSIYYNGGKVGVGTNTPQTLFSVKQNEAISVGSRAYMSSGTTTNGGDFAHFSTNAWFSNGAWQYPNGVRKGALMQIKNDTINFFTHNGNNGFTEKLSMYGNLAEFPQNQTVQLGNAYMSSGTYGNAQISNFGTNAWFGNGAWNFIKDIQGNSLHGAFIQTYNKDINFFTHDGTTASFANTIGFNKTTSGTFINFDDGLVANTTPEDENKKYQIGVSAADGNKFAIRHVRSQQSLLLVDGNKAQVVIGRATPNEHSTLLVVGDLECIPYSSGSSTQKIRPDYVFENAYKLMPLEEVASFIKANKHLPKLKSAKEIEEAGGKIQLGEFSYQLLEKVEELTLYAIEQDKKIKQQSELIEKLTKRLENLEKKLN